MSVRGFVAAQVCPEIGRRSPRSVRPGCSHGPPGDPGTWAQAPPRLIDAGHRRIWRPRARIPGTLRGRARPRIWLPSPLPRPSQRTAEPTKRTKSGDAGLRNRTYPPPPARHSERSGSQHPRTPERTGCSARKATLRALHSRCNVVETADPSRRATPEP